MGSIVLLIFGLMFAVIVGLSIVSFGVFFADEPSLHELTQRAIVLENRCHWLNIEEKYQCLEELIKIKKKFNNSHIFSIITKQT